MQEASKRLGGKVRKNMTARKARKYERYSVRKKESQKEGSKQERK